MGSIRSIRRRLPSSVLRRVATLPSSVTNPSFAYFLGDNDAAVVAAAAITRSVLFLSQGGVFPFFNVVGISFASQYNLRHLMRRQF